MAAFHLLVTGLFVDAQRVSGAGFAFVEAPNSGPWSIVAFAVGFATLIASVFLLMTVNLYMRYFKDLGGKFLILSQKLPNRSAHSQPQSFFA